MKIVVYIYTDPLLDTVPNQGDWGWEIDKIYEVFRVIFLGVLCSLALFRDVMFVHRSNVSDAPGLHCYR